MDNLHIEERNQIQWDLTKRYSNILLQRERKSRVYSSGLSPHRKTTFAKCGLSNTYESVCGGGEGGIPIGY